MGGGWRFTGTARARERGLSAGGPHASLAPNHDNPPKTVTGSMSIFLVGEGRAARRAPRGPLTLVKREPGDFVAPDEADWEEHVGTAWRAQPSAASGVTRLGDTARGGSASPRFDRLHPRGGRALGARGDLGEFRQSAPSATGSP